MFNILPHVLSPNQKEVEESMLKIPYKTGAWRQGSAGRVLALLAEGPHVVSNAA